jgi:hypothetical protein
LEGLITYQMPLKIRKVQTYVSQHLKDNYNDMKFAPAKGKISQIEQYKAFKRSPLGWTVAGLDPCPNYRIETKPCVEKPILIPCPLPTSLSSPPLSSPPLSSPPLSPSSPKQVETKPCVEKSPLIPCSLPASLSSPLSSPALSPYLPPSSPKRVEPEEDLSLKANTEEEEIDLNVGDNEEKLANVPSSSPPAIDYEKVWELAQKGDMLGIPAETRVKHYQTLRLMYLDWSRQQYVTSRRKKLVVDSDPDRTESE